MALSAAQIASAKDEAREFLEYSIYALCVMLGVNVAEVDSTYVIPVDSSDETHVLHLALQRQVQALEALG